MKASSFVSLFCFFLLSASTLRAQEVRFGIQLGGSLPGIENFDFTNSDGLDGFGIHGGGIGEYKLGAIAGTAGLRFDYNQFSGSVNGFDTDYFYARAVLPVAFKYYVAETVSIQAGMRFGVRLIAESETTVEGQMPDRNDISLTTSPTDLGAFFGVGYDAPGGFTALLTYNMGITDFPSADDRLSGPELSLGYAIFRSGSSSRKSPSIKGKKWKPGRTRSGG